MGDNLEFLGRKKGRLACVWACDGGIAFDVCAERRDCSGMKVPRVRSHQDVRMRCDPLQFKSAAFKNRKKIWLPANMLAASVQKADIAGPFELMRFFLWRHKKNDPLHSLDRVR